MLAEIIVDELKVDAIIGVNPEERTIKQPLHISLSFQTDIEKAAETDDIKSSVDYDYLTQNVKRFVEQSSFQLIETLAEEVAHLILSDQRIHSLSLFIYKPNAIKDAKRVGIKILRQQKMKRPKTNQPANQLPRNQPANQLTNLHANEPTNQRTNEHTNKPTSERMNEGTNERTSQLWE